MFELRLFVFNDGSVLHLIMPLRCDFHELNPRLMEVFGHSLVASRAEVWRGDTKVMTIYAFRIASFVEMARRASDADPTARDPMSRQTSRH